MTPPRPLAAFLALAAVAALAPACAGRQPQVRVLPPALPPGAYGPPGANAAVVPPSSGVEVGAAIARTAETLVGAPYREGGALPDGFDCSGLVNYVLARNGIAVPRDVRRQAAAGAAVPRSGILPGDLVFFSTSGSGPTHVGIAIGGGRFVHAPKSGAVVRVESMASRYWETRLIAIRRMAGSDLEPRHAP